MKKILISLVLALSTTLSFAQYHPRRTVEVEIGLGALQSFDKMFFKSVSPGACAYAEVKYVFKKIPLDLGINASAQIFIRNTEYSGCDFTSRNIMIVSDYSFYSAPRIRMYGGLGIGQGFYDFTHNTKAKDGFFVDSSTDVCYLCVMPRVGLNISNRFNIALGYLFEDTANANLSLRLGFIF